MKDVAILTIVGFILFAAVGITAPINSLYAESLGASYIAIGVIGSVASLTTILFSAFWGHASDHLGQRKAFLVLGLGAVAASYGLRAVAPSYEYLYPISILAAIAMAAYSPTSLALMGDLLEQHPEKRGRRMGVYRGLGSLGFALTAFVSGSVADRFSIRAPFGLSALLLVVAFLLALRVGKSTPSDTARKATLGGASSGQLLLRAAREAAGSMASQFATLFRPQSGENWSETEPVGERLPLAPLLISAFVWSLAFGAVLAVWPNYMIEVGYTQADVGRLWSLAALTEFPLMVLTGRLSDRVGRLPMLGVGFLAWTLVFCGYVFVPQMPWILIIQLGRGFAYAAFTAAALTYAAEARSKAQRGWVSGLYSSSSGIGSILGSFAGGAQAQFAGFQAMILTNAALFFGGAVYLATVAVRREGRGKRRKCVSNEQE